MNDIKHINSGYNDSAVILSAWGGGVCAWLGGRVLDISGAEGHSFPCLLLHNPLATWKLPGDKADNIH